MIDKPNQYSIWEFNQKELKQIRDLIERWEGGQSKPIDRRRYTKNVLNYALRTDLVRYVCRHGIFAESREYLPEYHSRCEKCNRREHWRVSFCINQQFNIEYEAPIAVIWGLVRDMLYHTTGEPRGFTLTMQKDWRIFGIWENGHKRHTQQHLDFIYRILHKLAQYNFIIFQHAGNIWQIIVLKDNDNI